MNLKNLINTGLGERDRIFTINVEVTGCCNSHCTYCHFFLKHDRKTVAYHMPMQQFKDYCAFIRYWNDNSGNETNCRFSGGDPITLKDELFERANIAYNISGLNPFLLTHGRNLTNEWFIKAKNSALEAIYFSVENPINPDPGAQVPHKTIDYVLAHDSALLPIKLGVCVIPNDSFKDLLKICDWFYERVGYIPPLAEINYGAYEPLTETQWQALEKSLNEVMAKYFGKTHLNLFHSVSPELSYDGADPYVFSLGLINRFNIDSKNIEAKAIELVEELKNLNYPFLNCQQNCNWTDFCVNTKWYWQGDSKNSKTTKLKDYCRFKHILNDTYYRFAVDSSHNNLRNEIDS